MEPIRLDYVSAPVALPAPPAPELAAAAFYRPRKRYYVPTAIAPTAAGVSFLGWGAVVGVGRGGYLDTSALGLWLCVGVGLLGLAAGALTVLRGARSGVGYSADAVVVRGLRRTRVIPFAALGRCEFWPGDDDGAALAVRLVDRAGRRVLLPPLDDCLDAERADFAAAVAAGIARAERARMEDGG